MDSVDVELNTNHIKWGVVRNKNDNKVIPLVRK